VRKKRAQALASEAGPFEIVVRKCYVLISRDPLPVGSGLQRQMGNDVFTFSVMVTRRLAGGGRVVNSLPLLSNAPRFALGNEAEHA
jgi:hypothetical protein